MMMRDGRSVWTSIGLFAVTLFGTVAGDSASATACSQLVNGTTYLRGDLSIPILTQCSYAYDYSQVQQVVYVDSFLSCITSCVLLDSPWPCLGIQYENNTLGPDGGSMCWLLWNTTAPPTSNDQADSATLGLNSTSPSAAVSPRSSY
jgi:hypothetical protein